MINEVYFTVTVTKVSKGIRETREYVQVLASDHPEVIAGTAKSYDYKDITKAFTDKETIFEQRLDYLDLPRILRAANYKPSNTEFTGVVRFTKVDPVESCT